MHWIFLALLSPAIYTCVAFIDKYIVDNKVKDARGMALYGAIAAFVFGTLVWLIVGRPILTPHNAFFVLLSGVLTMLGFIFYFYAISKNHASYILALNQVIPLFTLVMAYIFLHEYLTIVQLAGFFVVLFAILGLSLDKENKKLKLDNSFFSMLFATFLFACGEILIKFTVNLNDFFVILVYESWGIALAGFLVFLLVKEVRTAFLQSFRSVGRSVLAIMFINEAIFIVSKTVKFMAISLGPVALVGVLSGTQIFYGLLFGIILTILFPKFFHEETRLTIIRQKFVFLIILFIGIYLITV